MKGFSRTFVIKKKAGGTGSIGVCCLVAKSCLTPYDSTHCSSPGSSVRVISQATILEWVAISSSKGSTYPSQGSNPHLLHWQKDSLSPGKPDGVRNWDIDSPGVRAAVYSQAPKCLPRETELEDAAPFLDPRETQIRKLSLSHGPNTSRPHPAISYSAFKMHPESDRFSHLHLPCEPSLHRLLPDLLPSLLHWCPVSLLSL